MTFYQIHSTNVDWSKKHGRQLSEYFGNILKILTRRLGLDDMSLAWPTVVQLLVFIYSGIQ